MARAGLLLVAERYLFEFGIPGKLADRGEPKGHASVSVHDLGPRVQFPIDSLVNFCRCNHHSLSHWMEEL